MKKKIIKILALLLALSLAFSGCEKEPEEEPKEQTEILISEISTEKPEEPETPPEEEPKEPVEEPPEAPQEEPKPEEPKPTEPEVKPSSGKTGAYELILVNPTHYIPEGYEPDLETVQGKYKMDKLASSAAKELVAAAKAAGYDMQLCSAYRTVEKSAELYERQVKQWLSYGYDEATAKVEAAKWVAPPGTSEHHTGLAMDLVSSDYWGQYSDLEHAYENFDSFKWMVSHCAEYGFILRYPKDKQDITGITYEPWHYRYVGKENAAYIMENGLCLEEYLGETGQ